MNVGRRKNPHNIAVRDWQLMHGTGSDRASLRVEFDVPMHPRLTAFTLIPGMNDVLAAFIDDRTKSRLRRIWDALR